MVKTGFNELSDFTAVLITGALLIQNAQIISAALFALLYSSEDCNDIARTWLIVDSSCVFFAFCLFLFYKFLGFSVWLIWNIIWNVLGIYWIFHNNNCEKEYPIGFTSIFICVSVSFFMVTVFLAVAMFLCIGTCIGHGLSSESKHTDKSVLSVKPLIHEDSAKIHSDS